MPRQGNPFALAQAWRRALLRERAAQLWLAASAGGACHARAVVGEATIDGALAAVTQPDLPRALRLLDLAAGSRARMPLRFPLAHAFALSLSAAEPQPTS